MTTTSRANLSVVAALATGFSVASACDPGPTRDHFDQVYLSDEFDADDGNEQAEPQGPDDAARDLPTGSGQISMAPAAMALCRGESGGDWCSASGAGEDCSKGCCGVLTGGEICNDDGCERCTETVCFEGDC